MAAVMPSVEADTTPVKAEEPPQPKQALTPPTSDEGNKREVSPDDLSELDLDEDDIGDIEPDHYYDDGKIPVFKPTMDQFRSFKKFIAKINHYGMKAGIVKVIPPAEWRESLPALDEAVKTIRVKNPITQDFAGTHGTYTQANIEKQRSYNLPQWKALTDESNHQPPAKRGERRKNQDKVVRNTASSKGKPASRTSAATSGTGSKRGPGRPPKKGRPSRNAVKDEDVEYGATDETEGEVVDDIDVELEHEGDGDNEGETLQVPPTPVSPNSLPKDLDEAPVQASSEQAPSKGRKPKGKSTTRQSRGGQTNGLQRQPKESQPKGGKSKSVSDRRKYNRREVVDYIDEAAFDGFDYRIQNQDEYTVERCHELENLYWKGLTFAPPMYGADMPGSLFDESTTSWNVANLESVLDVLQAKIPGVNTAYLYLGMWKATFAWHLEDVDLYSINYIHFGAPKQWYSISQEDARRFENAMKNIWPSDAKNCSQFLRHKTYLISPALLQAQYNIRVNKLVHHEGEFVITFPYGYHSGYNLGYNCAESVNFATEDWIEYGKLAKRCECISDSVWVDAHQIERRLRGEPTPEIYEEITDDEDDEPTDFPTPPASVVGKAKTGRKRKRDEKTVPQSAKKKVRVRVRKSREEPCMLCPNHMPTEELLPTDNGLRAHRVCAEYTPETYVWDETVCEVGNIRKDRLGLKCSYCRQKKGACFQCSSKKCTRAYHATCAAAAGVRVEQGRLAQWLPDDETEYYIEDYDFRCKYHRTKRPKTATADTLENKYSIQKYGNSLKLNDIVQMQHLGGDIFAGVVMENRRHERGIVVEVIPEGDRIEVDYRFLLPLDPADSQMVQATETAKPLPLDIDKDTVQATSENGPPMVDDPFCDPESIHKWAEFHSAPHPRNRDKVKPNLFSDNKIWHYLGGISKPATAKYTEDPSKPRSNERANFLASVPQPHVIQQPFQKRGMSTHYPSGANYHALNGAMAASKQALNKMPALQPSYQNQGVPYKPRPNFVQQRNQSNQGLSYGVPNRWNPNMNNGSLDRKPSGTVNGLNHNYQLQSGPEGSPGNIYRQSTTPYDQAQLSNAPMYGIQDRRGSQPGVQQNQQWPTAHSPSAWSPVQSLQRPAPLASIPTDTSSTSPSVPSPLSEYMKRVEKYPYLRNALLRRPQTYSSPYQGESGFSDDWLRVSLPQQAAVPIGHAYTPLYPAQVSGTHMRGGYAPSPLSSMTNFSQLQQPYEFSFHRTPLLQQQISNQFDQQVGQNIGYSSLQTGNLAQMDQTPYLSEPPFSLEPIKPTSAGLQENV